MRPMIPTESMLGTDLPLIVGLLFTVRHTPEGAGVYSISRIGCDIGAFAVQMQELVGANVEYGAMVPGPGSLSPPLTVIFNPDAADYGASPNGAAQLFAERWLCSPAPHTFHGPVVVFGADVEHAVPISIPPGLWQALKQGRERDVTAKGEALAAEVESFLRDARDE